jgi:hypothetical protein
MLSPDELLSQLVDECEVERLATHSPPHKRPVRSS